MNLKVQKKSDYINNRNEHNNIIIRNHQIININDTSKRIKRNKVIINEIFKKEIENKDNKNNKEKIENKEKDTKQIK